MKLSVVNALVGILSGVKLNKISDREVKTTLINDYLHLRKFVKGAMDDKNEIANKFQSDWRDEFVAVETLRREGKPVIGHEAYLAAEADANKQVQDLFNNEVEVTPKAVKMDAFLAACGGEELTLEQIALLQEGGIIE